MCGFDCIGSWALPFHLVSIVFDIEIHLLSIKKQNLTLAYIGNVRPYSASLVMPKYYPHKYVFCPQLTTILEQIWLQLSVTGERMDTNAWDTLKPTVGRPDFFLCWSADKHGFDRPTGAVTLKAYLTDYLHRPQSLPFGRPLPDDRPTAFPCRATCNESADDQPTCWGLWVDRSYDILASVRMCI